MSEASPTIVLPCPSCGQVVSGNYCSFCGCALLEEEENPYKVFAKNFLNINGLKKFITTYIFILRKPVENTLITFKKIRLEEAVKFFVYSVGFAAFFSGTKSLFNPVGESIAGKSVFNGFISEMLVLLYLVTSYYFIMKLFYRYASKKFGEKNKKEYIKMYCLFAGFTLPIITFFYTIVAMLFFELLWLRAISAVTCTVILANYGAKVWQFFWKAPGNKVFAKLMTAGLVVFAVSYFFILILFAILGYDLPNI